MPKMSPGRSRRGGGKVSSSFNALADPTASNAFSSRHDISDEFEGDDAKGNNFTTYGSAWSGGSGGMGR